MDTETIRKRHEELKRIDDWLVTHPWQARFLAIGGAILIFELSLYLQLALEAIARWAVGAAP